ncbi:uncharacterized protein LOC127808192 isoform X2 [Diospyros lotus]|uniref:uncharacterized protein LOC127808192 isoform X2 n=1 Tax=Diospyros lotus TaxID=55363 RepID=UPI00225B0A61|nr:uncharacterized protein LOC127808192 isoform X2 [Diospyros lotus]
MVVGLLGGIHFYGRRNSLETTEGSSDQGALGGANLGGTSFVGSMFSGFQSTSPEAGVVGARNSVNSISLQRCPLTRVEIPPSMRFPAPNSLSPISHSQQQFQTSMPHQEFLRPPKDPPIRVHSVVLIWGEQALWAQCSLDFKAC